MCGIVGYVGRKQAGPLLLDGLSRLEYRGYDSAGIAVFREDGGISISKAVGKLSNLIKKTEGGALLPGRCGIGHTRWATHGAPSEQNAHPHVSMHGGVTLVHNGIIENDRELREELLGEGFRFYSETDTEVAANYIEYCFDRAEGEPKQAIRRFMERARGSYALAILFQGRTDEIWAVRKDSPMIIGRGEDGCCLASDVQAILKYSDSACYIGNREIARLTERGISFFDEKGRAIEKEMGRIEMDGRAAEKGIYPHFMLKEIHEQPAAVEETLRSMLRDGRISLSGIGISDSALQKLRSVWIVACGSAFYAGTALQYGIEALAGILVRTELASEFRYRKPLLSSEDLVILISQSGETADTLAALREAKLRGASTLAIVNVPGSSIAREADYVLYTLAGPEVSVATTKAYSAQLMAGYILCLALARAGETDESGGGAAHRSAPGAPGEDLPLPLTFRFSFRDCGVLPGCAGCLFPRERDRLRGGTGGCPQAEGVKLYPRGGLCGRRTEARGDQPDRRRRTRDRDSQSAGAFREDAVQYGGGEEPGRLPLCTFYGKGQRASLRNRREHSPPGDRAALFREPLCDPAPAPCLPGERAPGIGRGPPEESREIRDGGVKTIR